MFHKVLDQMDQLKINISTADEAFSFRESLKIGFHLAQVAVGLM